MVDVIFLIRNFGLIRVTLHNPKLKISLNYFILGFNAVSGSYIVWNKTF